MVSDPDQNNELSVLHGDDGSVYPNSPHITLKLTLQLEYLVVRCWINAQLHTLKVHIEPL